MEIYRHPNGAFVTKQKLINNLLISIRLHEKKIQFIIANTLNCQDQLPHAAENILKKEVAENAILFERMMQIINI